MIKNTIILFLTFIFLSPFQKCFAWGKSGHFLVGDIANSIMSESAKRNVQKYLGTISFEEASVWMDELRSNHQYDYMRPWHYINIEIGENELPEGPHIIERLDFTYNELQNRQKLSIETITTDILILFHLTGDLFQPLHVGYGSDKGGNSYQVSLNGKGSNLHHVWDTDIIQEEHISVEDCMALYTSLTEAQKVKVKNTSYSAWLTENRKLLVDMYPANNKIDGEYLHKNKHVVITQLLYAGMKLASSLESLFASDDRVIITPKIEKISAEEATKHIGNKVIVCSMVYGVKELAGVNFINLSASYPNSPLTVVVFNADKVNFKNGLVIYENKKVCVSGTIKEYKGKTEIIITKPEDIVIQ
jgi:hypothetical protein